MKPLKIKREYPSIVNAPYGRRIQAYLIDFIFILLIGLISFGVIDNIYSKSNLGKKNNDKLFALRIESGLYINAGNGNATLLGEDITTGNYELLYLTRLEHFYTKPNTHFNYVLSSYYVEGQDFDFFRDVLEKDKESSPFTFDDTFPSVQYRLKAELGHEEKLDAWAKVYNEALKNLKTDPGYIAVETATRQFVIINLTLSAFIGTIFPWLLCPLFFGHGRSIGKFFMRLAVVNKAGYKIKVWQVFVRFLVFGIIETALNFYGFFIPLMLTSGVLTITKNNRALHDLTSNTFVVDAKESKIFNNFADEEAYYKSSIEEKALNNKFFSEGVKLVLAPKKEIVPEQTSASKEEGDAL